jgi:hypothetical protein
MERPEKGDAEDFSARDAMMTRPITWLLLQNSATIARTWKLNLKEWCHCQHAMRASSQEYRVAQPAGDVSNILSTPLMTSTVGKV